MTRDPGPLFALALARATDPESSHAAAREVERSGKAPAQRERVLAAVLMFPGLTSAELAEHLPGMDRYAVARRLPELARSKTVRRGPIRRCASHGTDAVTWWPGEVE